MKPAASHTCTDSHRTYHTEHTNLQNKYSVSNYRYNTQHVHTPIKHSQTTRSTTAYNLKYEFLTYAKSLHTLTHTLTFALRMHRASGYAKAQKSTIMNNAVSSKNSWQSLSVWERKDEIRIDTKKERKKEGKKERFSKILIKWIMTAETMTTFNWSQHFNANLQFTLHNEKGKLYHNHHSWIIIHIFT